MKIYRPNDILSDNKIKGNINYVIHTHPILKLCSLPNENVCAC